MRIALILHSPQFERSFKKLPKRIRLEVLVREKWFRKNFKDTRLKTHKLSGKLEGEYAFSLTQKYRVLFRFISDTEVVFDDVGDHTIYR